MPEIVASNYSVVEFIADKATPREWKLFHEYRRVRHAEIRPEDPLVPDEQVEEQLRRPDPFSQTLRFAIYEGGRMISALDASWLKPEAPAYETNKHLLFVEASVFKPYRRRGIGTLWAQKAAELARVHECTILTASTEEDQGHAFLRWLGANEKQKTAEYRLELKDVEWKMVDLWINEGRQKSPETALEFFENRLPEDIWDDFCQQYSVLLNTVPFDDLDHGEIAMTPAILREEYERLDMLQGAHHTYLTREKNGVISGITDVLFIQSEPDRVTQLFTGVLPDAQGRGLGKWLKAAMLQFIRREYPSIRWVVTGNANSNEPMLAINRRLGFGEYRSESVYQLEREELESFLSG